MTYLQKYTLVQFLEAVEGAAEFSMAQWPLHITMADVFAIDLKNVRLNERLAGLLAAMQPFTVTVGELADLGPPASPTRVRLIDPSNELRALHETLINFLEGHEAVFNTPEYTRKGFLPHVTVQGAAHLPFGTLVSIHCLSLVDMFPGGDHTRREVLASFPLMTSI